MTKKLNVAKPNRAAETLHAMQGFYQLNCSHIPAKEFPWRAAIPFELLKLTNTEIEYFYEKINLDTSLLDVTHEYKKRDLWFL